MSSAETTPRSIKQHIKDGDKVNHIKLPTNAEILTWRISRCGTQAGSGAWKRSRSAVPG